MDRRAFTIAAVIVAVLLFAYQTAFTVKETEFAINLQFSELVRSDYGPGLHLKLPLVQTVEKFEKRVMTRAYPQEQFLTSEGKLLDVDFYMKWRIADVGQYYRATGGIEDTAAARLSDLVKNGLKSTIAKRTIGEVVATERSEFMASVLAVAADSVKQLGVAVVDVRVKRIGLPNEVSDSVYTRMGQEFSRQAAQLRAEGIEAYTKIRAEADRQRTETLTNAAREAETMRGEGDARAAAIFAAATSRNPEFFAFYRSMQAYRRTIGRDGDLMLLSLDGPFFKYLQQPPGAGK